MNPAYVIFAIWLWLIGPLVLGLPLLAFTALRQCAHGWELPRWHKRLIVAFNTYAALWLASIIWWPF